MLVNYYYSALRFGWTRFDSLICLEGAFIDHVTVIAAGTIHSTNISSQIFFILLRVFRTDLQKKSRETWPIKLNTIQYTQYFAPKYLK